MSYSLRKQEGFWARAILGTSLVLGSFGLGLSLVRQVHLSCCPALWIQ